MTKKSAFAGLAIASALVTVQAAPAQATAAGSCYLSVTGTGYPGFHKVNLNCVPAATGDVMAVYKVYGEDTFSDDLLFVVDTRKSSYTFTTHENYINEDFPDWDEIYVTAWYRKPNGSLYRIRSNKVNGAWGNGNWNPPPQYIYDKS
ncbi:hypothetical protein Aph01nite_17470 [Acrocarpospora phusangensis]|uniref:Streptomyces killer toxin-like beta/gamma crystallin domain-containing protein n=1 Tax=Acrocarpospora phusangensis TaxID=1070424 RepID=A0A919Q6X6_9ACTN|nr:hypothetical protein [Acrocarpospora phusangensis]GIH23437.1 hypothetical protein Aph01nite_17470 [Acrocarpospora phusangensis]